MDINKIIIYIMVFFVLIGAMDRIIGNRFGIGGKFEEGIKTMGTLTVSTAGILILAPMIGDAVSPVIVPFFEWLRADPAMFAGMLLGTDIGGAPLAQELAESADGFALGGIITSSMLGATISFTIPVGMGIAKEEYQKDVAKGILIGIITIPVGVVAGGFVAGIRAGFILINTLPVAVLSLIIILCLWRWEKVIVTVFIWLGKLILAISIFGIGIGVLAEFTVFVPFKDAMPLAEVFAIIGNVAMILAGAFVLVELISRILQKPLQRIGMRLGVNDMAVTGLFVCLANNIPVFGMLENMNRRGRIMAAAFCVSGAFVFGDHLGFVAGYAPELAAAMVAAKLVAGISATILAILLTNKAETK